MGSRAAGGTAAGWMVCGIVSAMSCMSGTGQGTGGSGGGGGYKKPKAGLSGMEGAKDIPSWAKGKDLGSVSRGRVLRSNFSSASMTPATTIRDRLLNSTGFKSGATEHSSKEFEMDSSE